MTNRTVQYIAGISVCAVLANGALFLLAPHVRSVEISAIVWMTAIGIFVNMLTFRLPRSGQGSIAFIPFVAGVIISPSWMAAVAVIVSVVLAQISKRTARIKAVFNAVS